MKKFLFLIFPIALHAEVYTSLLSARSSHAIRIELDDPALGFREYEGNNSEHSIDYGFSLGYNYVQNNIFIGIEGLFLNNHLNKRINYVALDPDTNDSFFFKSGFSYAATIRTGISTQENSRLYLGVGAEKMPVQIQYQAFDVGNVSRTTFRKKALQFRFLLGGEYRFSSPISIRMELSFTPTVRLTGKLPSFPNVYYETDYFRAGINKTSFLVGLTYHFGSDDEGKTKAVEAPVIVPSLQAAPSEKPHSKKKAKTKTL